MDLHLLGEVMAGLMFFGVIGFLMLGFPVAFTLAGTSKKSPAPDLRLGIFGEEPGALGSRSARPARSARGAHGCAAC